MLRKIILCFAGCLLVAGNTTFTHAAEIVVIAGPGGETNATAELLSNDGTTLIGVTGSTWFRWTAEGGAVAITEPGFTAPLDVSSDGNIILGQSSEGRGLWTSGDGFNLLNITPPEGHEGIGIEEISDDGKTIVGTTSISLQVKGERAFVWTEETGVTVSGTLDDASLAEVHLSGDGSVVAGTGFINGATRAFRWVPGEAPILLGELPGGSEGSAPAALSTDGSVIVGNGQSAGGFEAMRWVEGEGMKGLGDLPGGIFFGTATDTSSNGNVVIGYSRSDQAPQGGDDPFVWTPNAGIRRLADVFVDEEVTGIEDWVIWAVEGVSDDGSVFFGWGEYESAIRHWYVDLGAPPSDPVGAATIEGYVDGIWSEDTAWSGGVIPKSTDHWLHTTQGGDGTHDAKMHGPEEIQDFTWNSSDTLNIEGWPGNWRQGNLIVNGDFHLADGAIHTTNWDPRVLFNGDVNLSGGTIGNNEAASAGGEFVFADNTQITLTGATWVFGQQYDPEHSQFNNFKTAVTWGTGSIHFNSVGLAGLFTVHMLGDTQTEGNSKNVFTRNLTGPGGFRKTGPGRFILLPSHNETPLVYDYEGLTIIEEGTFQCDGTLTSSQVDVREGATVSGAGAIADLVGKGNIGGSLTITDRFAPNDSGNGKFTFSGTSLTLQGQTRMDLTSFDPAFSDAVISSSGGSLILDGAILVPSANGTTIGQVFTLFSGFDEVVGTFADTPDGQVMTAPIWDSEGFALRVNYTADGVVITAVEPPEPTNVTGGFAIFLDALPGSQSDITGNSDNDPWPNIFEYLFGLDPEVPDGQVVDSLLTEENGDPCLVITFPFDPTTSGAFITVEKSEDLTDWVTIWDSTLDPGYQSAAVVKVESIEGIDLVSIKVPAPQTGTDCFARIAGSLSE